MSATTIPYHLRPNKTIEREIFLDLLGTLSPVFPLVDYQYVGFGGPFLEDFRLINKRVGLKSLSCIERDEDTHARQKFNCTSPNISFHLGKLEDVLPVLSLDQGPSIVWLDYSDSRNLVGKMQSFVDLLSRCTENSIIKLTLVADLPGRDDSVAGRLQRVKNKLGEFWPPETKARDLTQGGYGEVLLRALRLAFSLNRIPGQLSFMGACSFVYSDQTPMLTVTGVLVSDGGEGHVLESTKLGDWEHFNNDWTKPAIIDVPVLSLLEQKEVGLQGAGATKIMGFDFPPGRFGGDSLKNYRRYARLYPHFAKVEV